MYFLLSRALRGLRGVIMITRMNPSRGSVFYLAAILTFSCFIFNVRSEEPVDIVCQVSEENGDWQSKALAEIQRMEYNVSWQDDCRIPDGKPGYHMANRKQDLRLYFYPEGVRIIRRTELNPTWTLGLGVMSVGRETPVSAPLDSVKTNENRIFYNNDGITGVYENSPAAISFSLPVQKKPSGKSSLIFSVELDGELSPVIIDDSCVEFREDGIARVQMAKIRVQDKLGKNIISSTEIVDSCLMITVNDLNAAYPLKLEYQLVVPPKWSAEPDWAGAEFGTSVCTAGDVNGDGYSDLIIGGPLYDNGQNDEGKVWVFHGGPAGPGATADWFYESNNLDAHLGHSVSTAGDVNGDGFADVIIGAINYTIDTAAQGAALVFYGSNEGLGDSFTILQGDQTGSRFGSSVSTAGDFNGDGYGDVVVGAEKYDFGNNEGKISFYKGSESGIEENHCEQFTSWKTSARLGCSVRLAGDVNGDGFSDVIAGASHVTNGEESEGQAYVFHGTESGVILGWSYEPDRFNAFFGTSVSGAGDINGDGYSDVIIGAPGYENAHPSKGAVYIFYGSPTGLSNIPDKIIEPVVMHNVGVFGNSVSTAGDLDGDGYADIIVGASGYSSQDYQSEGAAYVFRGGPVIPWPQLLKENQAYSSYGASVSTAGDVNGDGYSDIIVGAPGFDNDEVNEGRCFLYYGKPLTPSKYRKWNSANDVKDCGFAHRVAGAGDVNGDGLADVMIGAPLFDNGQTNEGRIFVYHGKKNDLPDTIANATREPDYENALFGSSLTSADLNGDGYDDIIIGMPGYNNKGFIYIYYGSKTGIYMSLTGYFYGSIGDRFGESVSGAGDVNGDGYSDIIIGAPGNNNNSGRFLVIFGGAPSINFSSRIFQNGNQENAFLGGSVASAGDVNGDGYSDIIIGASGYSSDQSNEGRAYVYYGSFNGVNLKDPVILEADQEDAAFGISVSGAGDVNGDGYSDVIVGAAYYDNGNTSEGAAFIYPGGADGLSNVPMIMLDGAGQDNACFGYSVAGAGDVNGDGFADVIVGAYLRDNTRDLVSSIERDSLVCMDAGSAYIYLGSPTGPSSTPDWTEYFQSSNAHFGYSVAGAGDVNGDGFADVIIGAPGYLAGSNIVGKALIYLGGGGNGKYRDLTQISNDGDTRISRMCRSVSHLFRIGMNMHGPYAGIRIKPEFELKELGNPLDGTNTSSMPDWYSVHDVNKFMYQLMYKENIIYAWRIRTLYDPVTCPYQPHGPWYSIPWNGWQETDFRTGPNNSVILQNIIDYILGRTHYYHDCDSDGVSDVTDVLDFMQY